LVGAVGFVPHPDRLGTGQGGHPGGLGLGRSR
jgi:hypothetical protein